MAKDISLRGRKRTRQNAEWATSEHYIDELLRIFVQYRQYPLLSFVDLLCLQATCTRLRQTFRDKPSPRHADRVCLKPVFFNQSDLLLKIYYDGIQQFRTGNSLDWAVYFGADYWAERRGLVTLQPPSVEEMKEMSPELVAMQRPGNVPHFKRPYGVTTELEWEFLLYHLRQQVDKLSYGRQFVEQYSRGAQTTWACMMCYTIVSDSVGMYQRLLYTYEWREHFNCAFSIHIPVNSQSRYFCADIRIMKQVAKTRSYRILEWQLNHAYWCKKCRQTYTYWSIAESCDHDPRVLKLAVDAWKDKPVFRRMLYRYAFMSNCLVLRYLLRHAPIKSDQEWSQLLVLGTDGVIRGKDMSITHHSHEHVYLEFVQAMRQRCRHRPTWDIDLTINRMLTKRLSAHFKLVCGLCMDSGERVHCCLMLCWTPWHPATWNDIRACRCCIPDAIYCTNPAACMLIHKPVGWEPPNATAVMLTDSAELDENE
jgi:hypothetical protein